MSSLVEQLKIPSTEFRKPSVIVLIVSNLVPVFGVLFIELGYLSCNDAFLG